MLDPKSSKPIPFTALLSQQGWGGEVGSAWRGMTPRWIPVPLFSAPSRFSGYGMSTDLREGPVPAKLISLLSVASEIPTLCRVRPENKGDI